MTILNYLPDLEYIFFNDNDINNLIINNNCIYNLYNKLNDINIKLDLFKTWYLYNNGGIYFNCKNILYNNLNDLLELEDFYVNDIFSDIIYNNFLFYKNKKNKTIKNNLINKCINVFNSVYTDSYFNKNKFELNNCILNLVIPNLNNKIINYKNKVLIKLSYNGYYNNNNSIIINSINLWRNQLLYNNLIIDYNKINNIDHIVWINLDRCHERKIYMENLLHNINIPNTRISGIDGGLINLSSHFNNKYNLSNYEKACCLSHIKAINFLKNLEGEYFLVLEDDISFNNSIFFKEDIKSIIKNSPDFDILLITKIHNSKLNDLYTKWYESIYSAACYIITKKGINKIINIANFENDNFYISKDLNISDNFLYFNTNTYVYKYNFSNPLDKDSSFHENHLDMHRNSSLLQLTLIFEDFL
jgi:GR25 family glycosyltransferase involved in LPS biosynthesis